MGELGRSHPALKTFFLPPPNSPLDRPFLSRFQARRENFLILAAAEVLTPVFVNGFILSFISAVESFKNSWLASHAQIEMAVAVAARASATLLWLSAAVGQPAVEGVLGGDPARDPLWPGAALPGQNAPGLLPPPPAGKARPHRKPSSR